MATATVDLGSLTRWAREVVSSVTDAAALGGLDDAALIELLRQAEDLGRIVDAVRVLVAGEAADRSRASLGSERLSSRLGCRNAGEVIERVTLVSGATARSRMKAAQPLRGQNALTGELLPAPLPLLADALRAGLIGLDAVSAIAGELGPLVDRGVNPGDVARGEVELVAAAIGLDAGAIPEGALDGTADGGAASPADDLRIMAQTWSLYLDPDGTLPDEQKGLHRRALTIGRQREGTVSVRAEVLPEVAAQLGALLDAYLNPRVDTAGLRFVSDESEPPACTSDGGDPAGGSDGRSSAQKRHDAFAGVLAAAAASGCTPQLGGAAPTLLVTVTAAELAKPNGVAFLAGGEQHTAAVPVSVARHVACAGATQRLVFDDSGRLIALGAPQRVFTAHQRRAIIARDGECVIPGCHVPARWCEVHHVRASADGGPTHVENGVLVCWFHHRTIDTSGWRIEMRAGLPWIRAPKWIDSGGTWRRATLPAGLQHAQHGHRPRRASAPDPPRRL